MDIARAETTKDYLICAVVIGFPVIIQGMISALVSSLDVFMLGKLGEVAITAAAMSNQWFLLYMILANGVAAAASIFISQYWGKQDKKRIHHYMGILLYGVLGLSAVFGFFALFFPETIIRFYSMDGEVIREGTQYLRILAVSFFLFAITLTCSASLRGIGKTNIPMIASLTSLCCNAVGNYLLIFGNLGAPRLGIQGAAVATVFARGVEMLILIGYIVKKKPAVYGAVRDYLKVPVPLIGKFFRFGGLVILGEVAYAIGNNLYNVAYKYTGTQAQASLQIVQTLQGLALLFCYGFGSAAAVMIGTMLGNNDFEKAKQCSRTLTAFAMLSSLVMGAIVFFAGPIVIQMFTLEEEARGYVEIMVRIMACTLPLRTIVFMVICGILRSGGDNLYCFLANLIGVWLIGLPAVFLAAVVWKWPIPLVFLMAAMEEAGKLIVCGPRVLQGKWLRNLTGN